MSVFKYVLKVDLRVILLIAFIIVEHIWIHGIHIKYNFRCSRISWFKTESWLDVWWNYYFWNLLLLQLLSIFWSLSYFFEFGLLVVGLYSLRTFAIWILSDRLLVDKERIIKYKLSQQASRRAQSCSSIFIMSLFLHFLCQPVLILIQLHLLHFN